MIKLFQILPVLLVATACQRKPTPLPDNSYTNPRGHFPGATPAEATPGGGSSNPNSSSTPKGPTQATPPTPEQERSRSKTQQ